MYACTPLTTIDSEVIPKRSRRAGSPRLADGADNVFHSSAVFGTTFQVELSGAAMSACIAGLTSSGTGRLRAGTSSDRGATPCVCPATVKPSVTPKTSKPKRVRYRQIMTCSCSRALPYSIRVTLHGCSCGIAAGMFALLSAQSPSPEQSHPHFRNVAETSGLHFVHHPGSTSRKFYVDSVPGGLAVFDYNGDGRPDIFFTEGAEMPSLQKPTRAYANRLFRNDGGLRFTDVTDEAGVAGIGYAMGAAAADYDNDGRIDLFVAGVRRNQLLHNRGDGRFEDVTLRSGISSDEWAVAAGWFDYDNDGRLDLFVVNYVQWSLETDRVCADEARAIPIFCHPRSFPAVPNRLYRNRGDGTFEDVSARSGIAAHAGKGMSVAFADFDHDSRLDVFVTNDTVPNFLFRNNGEGTFTESAA